jgi:hypothetical protein
MADSPNEPGGLDAGAGAAQVQAAMQPKSDTDWKPTAVWPAAQRALEEFSKMPKASDEQIRDQFRRNREQRLKMENGSLSSNGPRTAEE